MNKPATILIVPSLVLALAGCGGSHGTSSSSGSAAAPPASTPAASPPAAGGLKISSATITGLGRVLVNAQGRTLYVFEPDKDRKVTCVSACAAVWPPAFLPSGKKPAATTPVKQSLLGSDPDPAGGRVITYAGWPLYTYVTDTGAGQANGQALNLNGGLWYTISPAGKVITKKP